MKQSSVTLGAIYIGCLLNNKSEYLNKKATENSFICVAMKKSIGIEI